MSHTSRITQVNLRKYQEKKYEAAKSCGRTGTCLILLYNVGILGIGGVVNDGYESLNTDEEMIRLKKDTSIGTC
jgi:hypothetical protein